MAVGTYILTFHGRGSFEVAGRWYLAGIPVHASASQMKKALKKYGSDVVVSRPGAVQKQPAAVTTGDPVIEVTAVFEPEAVIDSFELDLTETVEETEVVDDDAEQSLEQTLYAIAPNLSSEVRLEVLDLLNSGMTLTEADLTQFKGIGSSTAKKILAAIVSE